MSFDKKKVVLDSTYILPLYGIAVDGLESLERILVSLFKGEIKKLKLYIPSTNLLEAMYKLLKEFKIQRDKAIIDRYTIATRSLIENTNLIILNPITHPEISQLALKIRSAGHEDIFDCFIAGCAIFENAILLTQDKSLSDTLQKIPEFQNIRVISWKIFSNEFLNL